MQPTNLDEIKDIDKLKSLAYDQVQALEVAQANIRAINQRIAELQQEPEPKAKTG